MRAAAALLDTHAEVGSRAAAAELRVKRPLMQASGLLYFGDGALLGAIEDPFVPEGDRQADAHVLASIGPNMMVDCHNAIHHPLRRTAQAPELVADASFLLSLPAPLLWPPPQTT